ncbi:Protein ABHD17B [Gracilariopsis chorda]|uniref:Protein ABHD17B n=1 Tax=Gracilariopsis chorda TaxID=448386 RepID=A0A2V3IK41_9FLOR|nr:Protein ABHD17B [Gracilariopsis chorda]|eukprot:PXF42437.1 Protein ABHD17B [Gracilariopsis chorda]
MGQLYSHLVFRPPQFCTYQCTQGRIKYVVPDEDGLPSVHSTDLFWLQTALNFRIPCAFIRRPQSQYVVIYAHTNAEDLGDSIVHAHIIARTLNVDVIAFEYSGYGLSERPPRRLFAHTNPRPGRRVHPSLSVHARKRAEPSEKAVCADILAVYAYLTESCNVAPENILIFGRSIGSGPAVYCAVTRPIRGLVLIAPIASAVRVPLKRLNVTLPFIDTFPNIDRAAKIECPVLVIHGDIDDIVPKLHGEKLFRKLNRKGCAVNPLWIPNARHNNVVEDFSSLVFGRYLTFLDELKLMPLSSSPSHSCSHQHFHSDALPTYPYDDACTTSSPTSNDLSFHMSSRRTAYYHSQCLKRAAQSSFGSHPQLSIFTNP